MAETAEPTVKAVPSLAERIRALLPDHTHEHTSGSPLASQATTWTWTTPQGTWMVNLDKAHLLAAPLLSFTGPGGAWVFAWPDERGMDQLAVVLQALDAIGDDPDA